MTGENRLVDDFDLNTDLQTVYDKLDVLIEEDLDSHGDFAQRVRILTDFEATRSYRESLSNPEPLEEARTEMFEKLAETFSFSSQATEEELDERTAWFNVAIIFAGAPKELKGLSPGSAEFDARIDDLKTQRQYEVLQTRTGRAKARFENELLVARLRDRFGEHDKLDFLRFTFQVAIESDKSGAKGDVGDSGWLGLIVLRTARQIDEETTKEELVSLIDEVRRASAAQTPQKLRNRFPELFD